MSGFMVMMDRYFNNDSEDVHKIMVHNEVFVSDSVLLLYKNLVHFPDMGKGKLKKFEYIKKAFEEADRIVFHSFQPDNKWLLLCYLLREHMNKAVWIMWGIDLYNYKEKGNSLSTKVKNQMGETLRKMMRYPVAISETDMAVYNKTFGSYPVMCTAYPFMDTRFAQMDYFSEQMKRKKEKYKEEIESGEREEDESLLITKSGFAPDVYDGRFRILVGHNAYPFNNHAESIDLLERFFQQKGSEKVEVCMPLSYGKTKLSQNVGYVNAIKQYAAVWKIPYHVSFLDKLVNANSYTKYLSTIDVGVFNAERQNGLGNILQLLYMGKKIYMSKKNPLFEFLTSKGFHIHDVEELKTITLEELLEPETEDIPKQWIKDYRSIESVAKSWDVLFRYVKGEIDADTAVAMNADFLGN